ncbi:unnamed protein product [Spirodela intermedia]|uniref:O-acyltransferase WSD1 C-terminal domain-containing protein n=1 Tax=Spirodela intermedia TaxID=51605 RepID=A0A7I8KP90_SPIIN|nr:unnamed protein product [Spirodela intermedia]
MLLYSVESSIQLVSRVDKTAIAGVRLLPRKLALLALCLDDIKTVKNKLNAALEIHMLTYNGKAFLNVLVAADIIPAPELLCKSRVMDAEDYGSES